jgi:uncharacterized delta-60 repeat protein
MNRRPGFPVAFIALAYFGTAFCGLGAAGDVDPAFSGDGKTRIAFGAGAGGGRDLLVDANGRTIVAGTASSGSDNSFAVARYLSDGSLDASFGDSGAVITNVGVASPIAGFSGQEEGRAIALQSDGKIVVAGYVQSTTNQDFAVVRYNADGSLDPSFGAGGISGCDLGGADFGADVAIQSDGKIVVAGTSAGNFAVARFNSDGSLDSSFGSGGKVVMTGIIGDYVDTVAMTLQLGDKILVAGSPTAGSSLAFYIVRLNQNGSYDTSFGSGGLVGRGSAAGGGGHCTSIAIQPGTEAVSTPDRIVVAGYTYDGSREVFVVMRFNLTGTPDPTFDGDGEVDTDLAGVPNGSARAAAVKVENGALANTRKIVVAGSVSSSNGGASIFEAAVVRYNSNGSLDTTFDSNGIALFNSFDPPTALAVASGKILFTGGIQGHFATTRLNSDSSFDTGFDQDGRRVDEIGGARSIARGLALQPDGKIVVAGSGGGPFGINLALGRLNSDGTLDLSFDGDGKIVGTFGTDSGGTAVILQPDGKILVAGARSVGTNSIDAAVYRFNPNGSADTSFAGGIATSQFAPANDFANAVARQSDGRIVVGGYAQFGSNRDIELVRFNADGSIDNTFDFDGKVNTALGTGNDEIRAIAIQPDGKIVVAGYATNGQQQFLIARFTTTGALDPSFDQDGVVFTAIGSGDAGTNAVAIDKSGRVLAAGFSSNGANYDLTVVRYLPNGSFDTSFGSGGKVITALGSGDDIGTAIAIQPDGKIVVAGGVNSTGPVEPTTDFALVRYLEDGTLDTSYGVGGKVVGGFSLQTHEGANAIVLDTNANAVVAGETDQLFGVTRLLAGSLLTPATLANVSTRLPVETGNNVLIGGFIVTGTQPKKIIVRALGPSVAAPGALANPTLELYSGSTLIGSNDDWQNQPDAERQAVFDSGIPPSRDLEAALVRTLPANGAGYTAIVRGVDNGTGIGVVEAYDLDRSVDSELANISTRGFVQTADNVLIAGTIIVGETNQTVIIRALGPSLSVPGNMANPMLELRNQNGDLIEANDNWGDSPNKQAIMDSGIAPSDGVESAILQTLPANGAGYTAIVRGANDTTGIAVVEIYALQ